MSARAALIPPGSPCRLRQRESAKSAMVSAANVATTNNVASALSAGVAPPRTDE